MGVCVTQQAAKKRVLVVEDEILIAMDVEKILSDIDVEVVGPALSLAQAIPLASAEHLHAAVIDINLGTDEVATPVVEILKRRGIPFVFATGYADRIEAKDGPCIGKPFTRAALLEAVGPLLR